MSANAGRAFFAALLLCLGTIVSLEGTSARQTQPIGAYIALGDSITFGIGSSLPERRSYPVLVQRQIESLRGSPVPFTNLAAPGETAASFIAAGQLDAFALEVASLRGAGIAVDTVTVTLGGNEMLAAQGAVDADRQVALDEFNLAIDDALAAIRDQTGPDATIIMTTYYDLSEGDPTIQSTDAWWIEQFNIAIRGAAERYAATVADIAGSFKGNIGEFTYHPFDVHPKNQGYRAIARQVWRSLLFDQEPPGIEVVSAAGTSRRTPTLQLDVSDNVDVANVSVTMANDTVGNPIHRGDGTWVLLLDLRDGDADEYVLSIHAEDSAGNISNIEHRIVVQAD